MKKTAILLGILFIPAISFATPSISNVDGEFNHGYVITITGSGFGAKSPAKPIIWAPFERGSISADTSLSSGSLKTTGPDSWELSSADLPYKLSTKAIRGIPYVSSPWTKRALAVGVGSTTPTDKIFIFARRKYAHPTFLDQQMNLKSWRFWPSSQVQPDSFVQYRNYVQTSTGQTVYNTEVAPYSSGVLFASERKFNNQWFTEELQLSHSDIDVNNGTIRYWQDGKKYQTTSIRTRTAINGSTALWGQWYMQTHWTNAESTAYDQPPPSGAYVYYDDIYMDSTWSRVMLGNASNFDACTHREPLIPTVWSASSITAYFNQGSFPNGQSVYLFVVDSTGAASPGKLIAIGYAPPNIGPLQEGASIPNPPDKLSIN